MTLSTVICSRMDAHIGKTAKPATTATSKLSESADIAYLFAIILAKNYSWYSLWFIWKKNINSWRNFHCFFSPILFKFKRINGFCSSESFGQEGSRSDKDEDRGFESDRTNWSSPTETVERLRPLFDQQRYVYYKVWSYHFPNYRDWIPIKIRHFRFISDSYFRFYRLTTRAKSTSWNWWWKLCYTYRCELQCVAINAKIVL